MYTLYEIIDPISFEIRYVGITTINLEDRLKAHLYDKGNKHKYYWLQSILKKKYYPIIREVLVSLPKENACKEEIKLIAKYRSEGKRLTNILDGGELPPNHTGRKRSEETKRRMSLSLKGKKRTVEQNRRNSERQKGKKISKEVREKISVKMRELRRNESSPERVIERVEKQKLSRLKNKPRVVNVETKEVFLNIHEAGNKLDLTYLQVLSYIGRYKAKPDRPTKFKLQYLK